MKDVEPTGAAPKVLTRQGEFGCMRQNSRELGSCIPFCRKSGRFLKSFNWNRMAEISSDWRIVAKRSLPGCEALLHLCTAAGGEKKNCQKG